MENKNIVKKKMREDIWELWDLNQRIPYTILGYYKVLLGCLFVLELEKKKYHIYRDIFTLIIKSAGQAS